MAWRGRPAKARSTTRLPAALRDELGLDSDGIPSANEPRTKRPRLNAAASRKEQRRQQRHAKRGPTPKRPWHTHEQEVPSTQKDTKGTQASSRSHSAAQGPSRARPAAPAKQAVAPRAPTAPKAAPSSEQDTTRTITDPITGATRAVRSRSSEAGPTKLERLMAKSGQPAEVPERPSVPRSKRPLSAAEQDEEDEIRWLEYQLYGKKGANVREGDDVDELLDDLDRLQSTLGEYGSEEDEDEERSSAEESVDDGASGTAESMGEDAFGSDFDALDAMVGRDVSVSEDEASEDEEGEAEEGDGGSDEEVDDDTDDGEEEQRNATETGGAVAPVSAAPTKYVPPAMRARAKEPDEAHALQQQKLRRHVNGLLNRLGEGNVDTILGELESLYRTYARGDVTSMLTQLVLDTIAARTQLSEAIVVTYAVLLSAMHRVVGVEFGAFFVQTCVSRLLAVYTTYLSHPDASDEEQSAWSRECVNLVLLLCHLLNHKLLSAGLVYDLVRLFLGCDFVEMVPATRDGKRITELDIELVLRIVQSSGAQLRRDDAASLKTIADLTKQRLDEAHGASEIVADSSRARFMLETLQDPRQHKKAAGAAGSDTAQRLSKYLSTLERRRTLRTHTALHVGLRDLQDAETKGRWWLVGAAWSGHGADSAPGAGGEASGAQPKSEAERDTSWLPEDTAADALDVGSLARDQGMNTDARRAVFSTLMTASDYREAVQNLLQLKLNEVQRREIVRVLVHCVGSEPVYNPYYVLVGQQLAEDLPAMRITLQYVLWDYFREIGETHVGGEKVTAALGDAAPDAPDAPGAARKRAHLAQAYGTWLGHGALSLHVLRPVEFVGLQRAGVRFVQHLLVAMLLATQTRAPMLTDTVRRRLAQPPTATDKSAVERVVVHGTAGHTPLAQGLLVFVQQHVRKRDVAAVLGADEPACARVQWAARVARDTLRVHATAS
ncbi:suppressor of glycerol defect [Malassezia brasiliensis]|uniref:Suppressor of glycerol defect n=1 Tax=Malassezia brasiliensis TaxID=1821822 RepID=A0AAF0DSW7_9BASI|nr:suppressor of glycerol defect [Malassezia brasiliensis]